MPGNAALTKGAKQQFQGMRHAGLTHPVAAQGAEQSGFDVDVAGFGQTETDHAFGLCVGSPGSGDAGHGNRQVGGGVLQGALCHGAGHRLADRAVLLDQIAGHAQKIGLGLVRVSDKAALKDVRRAGNVGQRAGNQATGTAFRRGDHLLPGACQVDEGLCRHGLPRSRGDEAGMGQRCKRDDADCGENAGPDVIQHHAQGIVPPVGATDQPGFPDVEQPE